MVEFAWAWIDEATAEWALKRLPASSPLEKPSWLGRCCWEWARGDKEEPEPPRSRTLPSGPTRKSSTAPGGCAMNSGAAS